MRLDRLSSRGTSDGRTTIIILDKLICHVLKIIFRTNNLGAAANIITGVTITSQSQWPSDLRHELSSLARMLGSWV
jgi:hypothetical protein